VQSPGIPTELAAYRARKHYKV